MAGLCSRHYDYREDCPACNTNPDDVFPGWDEMLAEAEAAGEVECPLCNFLFYRTTQFCPLCQSWTWTEGGSRIRWPWHDQNDPRCGDPAWKGRFERVPSDE